MNAVVSITGANTEVALKPECEFGERVRFSRSQKNPRRYTMFTVRKGKHVYFGISKWNIKFDEYSRAEGVAQAKARAYAAINSPHAELDSFKTSNGFAGKFRVRDFTDMIKHFERLR